MGALLVSSPYLFGFATGGPEQWLPIVLGLAVLLQSVMTRYELGLVPVISIPVHLGLDSEWSSARGVALAARLRPSGVLAACVVGTNRNRDRGLHRDEDGRPIPRPRQLVRTL
jgi:hypothetical protein